MKNVVLVLLLGLSVCLVAQTKKRAKPVKPVNLDSPAWKAYDAKMDVLRKQATTALHAEYAREEDGDECSTLPSEAQISNCLAHEQEITTKNYAAYAKALTALLRVRWPKDPMGSMPLNRGTKFDAAERSWVLYRNKTCSAKSDAAYGGSGQGQIETNCLQDLTRRHMHELESLYKDE
ncbi:MAG: lysozyme inhibitor LprI family protein [Acidobacteriaceae bacterium]|jgi:uncharacterized protein YecT (DUF1311 family)|nr:lysozyme inhibitor LprI family protein [Acidobacteriaceae bacterium]